MKQPEQISQIKTLMARLDSGTNVDAGGLRRNPTSVYVDADLAVKERHTFFQNHPQMVGLSGDLPEPGSFLTIDEFGPPLLATRDESGRFRVFLNACRHRGVVLEEEARGKTRRFTCGFHAWTYDSAGTLVGLPKADHVGDIDRDCLGLIELPSQEKYGLLFMHPQVDGVVDIDDLLGPGLAAELQSWGLDELEFLGGDRYEIGCNWKLAMDTFGETYHFETLHSDTLAAVFHGNVQCYDTYGRNHRMLLCRRDIDLLRGVPEDQWNITHAALPVYWLFPNVQLMPNANGCYLVRAYPHPTDPGRHVSRISFYLWSNVAQDVEMTAALTGVAQGFAEIIRDEDYVASASQQRTAESGLIEYSVFGRNEPALHHYHNTYREALGMDLLPLQQSI